MTGRASVYVITSGVVKMFRFIVFSCCVVLCVGHTVSDIECQRENEFFECGSACDNECATLATQNRTHCPIKNIVCNRKCYCKDGFARDDKENCIPVEKCPKIGHRERRYPALADPICKGENEVHTDCRKSCPPHTCLSIVARFKCDSDEPCRKGCVCKPGYLRQNPTSPCKPMCQCNEMKNSLDCQNKGFVTKE